MYGFIFIYIKSVPPYQLADLHSTVLITSLSNYFARLLRPLAT